MSFFFGALEEYRDFARYFGFRKRWGVLDGIKILVLQTMILLKLTKVFPNIHVISNIIYVN